MAMFNSYVKFPEGTCSGPVVNFSNFPFLKAPFLKFLMFNPGHPTFAFLQGFRQFFLKTVERKNKSWGKYGEGLEGGIKKLRHCYQKGVLAGAMNTGCPHKAIAASCYIPHKPYNAPGYSSYISTSGWDKTRKHADLILVSWLSSAKHAGIYRLDEWSITSLANVTIDDASKEQPQNS